MSLGRLGVLVFSGWCSTLVAAAPVSAPEVLAILLGYAPIRSAGAAEPGVSFDPNWGSKSVPNRRTLAWGDVNGDGRLDLVCGSAGQGVELFLNEGGGLESDPSWESAPATVSEVRLGDLDQDGDLDLVCGLSSNSPTGLGLRIYHNEDGSFSGSPSTISSGSTTGISLGDVDQDGDLDLATSTALGVVLYENEGGSFTPAWESQTSPNPGDLDLGDIDEDGDLDLLCGNSQDRVDPALVFTRQLGPVYPGIGQEVAGAGDVNGDGYDDVIAGVSEFGSAYVFYGGPETDAEADLVLTEGGATDWFGSSVSGAGDVNGDGFADVIVGAHGTFAGGPNVGRVYVFFGGAEADAVPDLVLTGEADLDEFGITVSGAGDVNGDGFDDVIVGAQSNDAGGENAGRAYVFYGGPGADGVADLVFTGEAEFDVFGYSVSGAGDTNGDGFDDLIVGTLVPGEHRGRAYVFHGGPEADAVADLVLNGEAAYDEFGTAVSGAGDVNGDGFDDVIVGAPNYDAGGIYTYTTGGAYVFFGGPGADAVPDVVLSGEAEYGLFGNSVSRAGDVNGDGIADVIVGAPDATIVGPPSAGAYAGLAYVFFGRPGGDAEADLIFAGNSRFGSFGNSVSGAGDMNGDGFDDVIMTDPDDGGGRIFAFYGGPGGNTVADLVIKGSVDPTEEFFGRAMSAAGDVNGDGSGDLVMGAPGRAFVFFGGLGVDAEPDLALAGEAEGEWFGRSVAEAGDVNGDGFVDVIVGAPDYDAVVSPSGRAYVFLGGPGADEVADIVLTGEGAGDWFGRSVAGAGDVNADGFDDVMVGALYNDGGGSDAGRVYVYFGGPGVDAVADLILTGENATDWFGFSISGAGDVNGDGVDDVIVGAFGNDALGVFTGRVYVFHGGPSADAIPDLVLTGEAALDEFGRSVAGAGDVNADGFDDVIVGAYGSDSGGTDAGRAYLFYGGLGADAIPDLVFAGESAGDWLGCSVSGAGDVTGDGFDDVIVGAPYNDAGGTDAGRGYVYFGGPTADAIPDLVLSGASAHDNLGWSLSGVGDVNTDGFGDVLVGAPYNQFSSSLDGQGYLYVGGPDTGAHLGALYRNDGGFDLVPVWRSGEHRAGRGAALGDMNGDGALDAVMGGGNLCLFLNEGGHLSSTPSWSASSPRRNRSVALGDLDQDGDLDLVAGEDAGGTEVFLNRGGVLPTQSDWRTAQSSQLVHALALADVNDDGQLDLALAQSGSQGANTLSIYANASAAWFTPLPVWSTKAPDPSLGVVIGDVDLDGSADLAFVNERLISVHFGGSGMPADTPGWISSAVDNAMSLALGPVAGSTRPDLVCGGEFYALMYNNIRPGGSGQPIWISPRSFPATSVQLGDIDGDGDLDLVSSNHLGVIISPNTNGVLEAYLWSSGLQLDTKGLALGDVDLDGDPDLVCASYTSSAALFRNDAGVPTGLPIWVSPSERYSTSVALGDVSGDGRIDVAFGTDGRGDEIFLNLGSTFAPTRAWTSSQTYLTSSVILKDVNQDGRLDLICGTRGGTSASLRIYANQSTMVSTSPDWTSSSVADTRGIAAGDLDEDGDLDLVSANYGAPSTVHAGLRNPAYRGSPTAPVNQLPNNMATIRYVRVQRVDGRTYRIRFTTFDVESDPIWIFPEYRVVSVADWQPLAGPSARRGPLETSPEGVEHELDWNVAELPAGFPDVELRLRWTSSPSRAGLIQAAGTYLHEITRLSVRKPVLVPPQVIVPFSTVTIGDTTTAELEIANRGNQVLSISSVRLSLPELKLLSSLPLQVLPQGSGSLRIELAPGSVIPESTTVEIETNDPLTPRVTLLLGTRVLELEATLQVASGEEWLPLGQSAVILVTPAAGVHVESGWLFYRASGTGGAFADSVRLVRLTSEFIATIPGVAVTEAGLDLYVRLENSGIVRTVPAGAPGMFLTRRVTSPDRVTSEPQENSSLGFAAGQSVQVLLFLPEGSLFQSGTLHFREGGEAGYRNAEVALSGQLPSGVIPESAVGHRGVEYWVEVTTASGAILTDPPTNPSALPLSFATTVRRVEESTEHPAGRYRLVSFPLDFGEDFTETIASLLSDEAELGPYDAIRWRCFRYLTGEGQYAELSDPARAGEFHPTPGRAFWLVSRDAHQIDTAPVVGQSVALDSVYTIPLEPGWNQVGIPWAFPVAWAATRIEGVPVGEQDTVEPPVGWDPAEGASGAYRPDQAELLPFEGYWVMNAGAGTVALEIPPLGPVFAQPLPPADSRLAAGSGGWRIRVAVASAGLRDAALAGVDATALEARDVMDRSDPPPAPGRGLSVYFPHEDWSRSSRRYAADVRPEAAAGQAWALDVLKNYTDSGPGDEVILSFGLDRVPPETGVFLLDRELRRAVDLRAATDFRFISGEREAVTREQDARFLLIAGSEEYLRARQEEVEGAPFTYHLFQNRPNPFTSSTVIRYELALSEPVTLQIYDVQGRLVRALVQEVQGPGFFEVAWDGEDDRRRPVPSGSYYCLLSSPGHRETRKIIRIP